MNIDAIYENLEFLAEQVHNAWMEEKRSQGFHASKECLNGGMCNKCHPDMIACRDLTEEIKEYDRVTARTVLKGIEQL